MRNQRPPKIGTGLLPARPSVLGSIVLAGDRLHVSSYGRGSCALEIPVWNFKWA
jgi:hypothetical protein